MRFVLLATMLFWFLPAGAWGNSWCDDLGGGSAVLNQFAIGTSTPALVEAAYSGALPLTARMASVQALCRRFETETQVALARLHGLTTVEFESIRAASVLVIGLHGDGEDYEVVARALHDPSVAVRSVALDSLGRIACEACAVALHLVVEDLGRDAVDRRKAAQILGELEGEVDPELFHKHCSDEDPGVAAYAAIALSRTGDLRSVPFLMERVLRGQDTEWMRSKLIAAVEEVVGVAFGYTKPHAAFTSAEEKVAALGRLTTWWAQESIRYGKDW